MLALRGLAKTYRRARGAAPVTALSGISLDIAEGEFFALLGPSGCGKTTTLQSIAGLERPDSGSIAIGGQPVFDAVRGIDVPANRRGLGVVFQSYAIWPHMSVFENVAFPLTHGGRRHSRADIRSRVLDTLARVKLDDHAERGAWQLSGGQQQRVALARAIVHRPKILLLDEPLSNLDAKLRQAMRVELRGLAKSLGITAILVTHDQAEAMAMADRMALLQAGSIVQTGPPDEVFLAPRTAFAADFMGRSNAFPGRVEGETEVEGRRGLVFACAIGRVVSTVPSEVGPGERALLIVRPQGIAVEAPGAAGVSDGNRVEAVLAARSFLGDLDEAEFRVGETPVRVDLGIYDRLRPGSAAVLSIAPERCTIVRADG